MTGEVEEPVPGGKVIDRLAGGHAQQLHRLAHVEQGTQVVLPGGRALHEQGGPAAHLSRVGCRRARQGAAPDEGGTKGVDRGVNGAGNDLGHPAPPHACQGLSRLGGRRCRSATITWSFELARRARPTGCADQASSR